MEDRTAPYDLRFKTPSNYLLSGATQSGKTTWLRKFFEFQPVTEPIQHLLYFYADEDVNHQYFRALPNMSIKFIQNWPDSLDELKDYLAKLPAKDHKAVVFDDLYNSMPKYVSTLFTVVGSHYKTSFFLLAQTLFGSPLLRQLSLNSKYIVLFKNARDKRVYSVLSSQIAPTRSHLLKQAFHQALEQPYSYIICDFDNAQREFLRYRSHIFPQEWPLRIYTI